VVAQATGEIVARSDPKGTFPCPVPIGVSTGNECLVFHQGLWWCSVGTIGARVTDGTNVYALSNNHVYALEDEGQIGDPILQPGMVDMTADGVRCGSQAEIAAAGIGTFDTIVPITFKRNASNTVDAAMALTTTGMLGTGTLADDGYGTLSSTTVSASLGQSVQKYGRTTGRTTGTGWALTQRFWLVTTPAPLGLLVRSK